MSLHEVQRGVTEEILHYLWGRYGRGADVDFDFDVVFDGPAQDLLEDTADVNGVDLEAWAEGWWEKEGQVIAGSAMAGGDAEVRIGRGEPFLVNRLTVGLEGD